MKAYPIFICVFAALASTQPTTNVGTIAKRDRPLPGQTLTINQTAGNTSSPLLYGALYEDIYHSGDGGFYGELIRNRAFQGSSQNGQPSLTRDTEFWIPIGDVQLSVSQSTPYLTRDLPWSMQVQVAAGAKGQVGFSNAGFYGMNVDAAKRYAVSFSVRGDYNGKVNTGFRNKISSQRLSSTDVNVKSNSTAWTTIAPVIFNPSTTASNPNNTFEFLFDAAQVAGKTLSVNLLSVFKQTYKDQYNGMREDLAIAYQDMGASWIRLPGGNNMEGLSRADAYRYNETIGSIANRPGRLGTWSDIDTSGFGLFEQLVWAESMGQTVVLGIYAGLSIGGDVVEQANLQPYIDLALSEIEFIRGDSSTSGGKARAAMGHSNPFSLKYIEIGNEDFLYNGQDSYNQYRFNMFYNAIKNKYPDITLISSVIPAPNRVKGTWIDLHVYDNQDFFAGMYNAFDQTDRDYPVIVGEYACINPHGNRNGQVGANTFGMALAEGIMLLGAERNSDVIRGTSYGALDKSYDEAPDSVAAIKHTGNQILKSTSYYIQQLFAKYHGTSTLAVTTKGGLGVGPVYWSATKSDKGQIYMKLINYYNSGSAVYVDVNGTHPSTAQVVTMSAANCEAVNNLPQLGGETTNTTISTLTEQNGHFAVYFDNACEVKVLII